MGLDAIKIYADGACRGNQYNENIGAIGIVLLYKNNKKEIKKAFQDTTNNRMEILSVIEAFKLIKRYDIPVEVYSDSQYVVDSINNNWAKNKNKDLWEALYTELYKFKAGVKFIKVKGHSDNQYNNRADELANEAMDNFKRS